MEEKVRKAFDVARELSGNCASDLQQLAFAKVFDAMMLDASYFEPWRLTATGIQQSQQQSNTK